MYKFIAKIQVILNAFQTKPWSLKCKLSSTELASQYLAGNIVDPPDIDKGNIIGAECIPIRLHVLINFFVLELQKQSQNETTDGQTRSRVTFLR